MTRRSQRLARAVRRLPGLGTRLTCACERCGAVDLCRTSEKIPMAYTAGNADSSIDSDTLWLCSRCTAIDLQERVSLLQSAAAERAPEIQDDDRTTAVGQRGDRQ
jgi:hypothetical protein